MRLNSSSCGAAAIPRCPTQYIFGFQCIMSFRKQFSLTCRFCLAMAYSTGALYTCKS